MRMSDIERNARDVAYAVNAKVGRLQAACLGRSAAAKATLARLRRLGTPCGGSWASVGEEIFCDLPFDSYPDLEQDRALRSVRAALTLYATHQQSKSHGMAVLSGGGHGRGSFGSACRIVAIRTGGGQGVLRRMSVIESASDFAGVETAVRALVCRMRTEDVPLDYGMLARDLYLVQHDRARDGVFMGWAKDYFAYKEA